MYNNGYYNGSSADCIFWHQFKKKRETAMIVKPKVKDM